MKVENGAPVIFLCCEKLLPENIRKPEVSRANKTNIRLFHRTPPNDCFFLIHFLLAHRDMSFLVDADRWIWQKLKSPLYIFQLILNVLALSN